MKRTEVVVEHYYQKRFMGRKRLVPGDGQTVIGNTTECDLLLLGEDVSPIHAMIEFNDNEWTISDLGSEKGTWIQKQPIVCSILSQPTQIRIGQHELRVTPITVDHRLFKNGSVDTPLSAKSLSGPDLVVRTQKYHQAIVKKQDMVVDSALLPETSDFTFYYKKDRHLFKPPRGSDWHSTELGEFVVQQRLVTSSEIGETTGKKVQALFDPEMRWPLAGALAVLMLTITFVIFIPQSPNVALEDVKPDENRYTKMIYDAKAIKMKRQEALASRNSINKVAQETPAPASEVKEQKESKPNNKPVAKVVTQIRTAGLSQLIGKISMRAAMNAKLVGAQGQTPDKGPSARSMASVGGVSDPRLKETVGPSYKVDGVKTDGKAGGTMGYKSAGGLAMGNVGNAMVGVLEEETEIQGGLDKDVIAAIIEKHLGEIRYCYERQLSASPELYGKVLVKFVIGNSGAVEAQNIGLTTLKSAMVEGCILRRVAGWKFPQPKGGTQVRVTYPFLFKSTN